MQLEKKRLTFGLVIDWISGWGDVDYYQTKIISGVADYAKAKDINVMCFVVGRLGSPYEWERSRNLLFDFIHKNHVDGLIMLPTSIGMYETEEKMKSILDSFKDMPIVTLNNGYGKYHTVTINNYLGMRQVVDHVLKEHNCRRLAFIGGPKNMKESQKRFQAFYDSLKENDVPYYPELNFEGTYLFDSGNEAVKYFIENNLDFDGLICANDNMAIGAITELHKRFGKIPEHLSITGFDNTETSKFHALTTINQSFYEQAQISADMLYRLIEGREVESVREMPAEAVLRSSCGCAGNVASRVFAQVNNLLEYDSLDELCRITKGKILAELVHANRCTGLPESSEDYEKLFDFEEKIIDAFYSEFFNNKEMEFLRTWNSVIFWAISKKLSITFLQDILVCMRKHILSNLVKQDRIVIAENMFQAASIVICDAIQRTGAALSHLAFTQTEGLESLAEDMMANLDWKMQMDSVYRALPEYGIKKAYISIYEDRNQPLENSRLILGVNGNFRAYVGGNGLRFKTPDILPKGLMEELRKERFNVIIMALHQGDNPLGYGVFGFEDKVNKIYEIVRYNIGVALKGALLIESIKDQALDLERQVHERTSELSEINIMLREEIQKRKEADEQLKKAMKELELYNSQLRTQSIMDELTGLYNRRGFIKLAKEHFERAENANEEFLLIFGDMDGLKQINDKFGHSEGDFAIIKIAQILNETFRGNDIIARLGGDEFTVVVAGASAEDEKPIREKLKQKCDCWNNCTDKPYKVAISIGFAYFNPQEPMNFDDLLEAADNALYEEKRKKKSRH